MSEQVTAALRDEILGGDLPPGTSLREVALAERFAVSRNTVREAIRALVTEGLAQHSMHRGAVVAELSEADVTDLYRARALLESAAAVQAHDLPPAAQAPLEDAVARMAAGAAAGDGQAVTAADLAFHRALVALAGSARLDQFFANLQGELRLLLLWADRDVPDARKVDEHRRMLDLVRAGDTAGLQAAVAAHVADAEEVLLRVLRARLAKAQREGA
jgi:DNA-binding GntR family transcriptional regulator